MKPFLMPSPDLTIKKLAILLLLLGLLSMLQAQKKNLDIVDHDFQITELGIPKSSPSGYESILTVELNHPIYPEKEYEVGFWIMGRQLRDQGYSYPITVFPSNFIGRVRKDVFDLVESYEVVPTLTVNPPPSYSYRGHFTFTVRPDKKYSYLTVALKNKGRGKSPIDFREDVTVIGFFVRPLPPQPKVASARLLKKSQIQKTQNDTLPHLRAERKLMDSKKSYTTSQKSVRIGLYDHRRIDKDIVTISLNDQIIVSGLALKRKKQFFDIELRPGKNTITLHAENLGEVAPNTAAILIKSKTEEFMAVLESDLGQSEFFTLVYRPK